MLAVIAKVVGFGVLMAAGSLLAQERLVASADGLEVTDNKTKLIWRRCAEGMIWKGKTCSGEAGSFTQAEATAKAAAAGGDWRLPNLREMSSLASARESQEGRAAINPQMFPGTPPVRFWSSSGTGPGYFSYVSFSDGSAGEGPRTSPGAARLVRSPK